MAIDRRPSIDPWIDPATRPLRSVVLAPLVDWIASNWAGDEPIRLLDFGCGDSLVASLLGRRAFVDGFDISPIAGRAARVALSADVDSESRVFEHIDDIPAASYHGIVVSSVFQYFASIDEVASFMRRADQWLLPAAAGVVVTDVVTPGVGRAADAYDLVSFLVAQGGFREGLQLTFRTARRSRGRVLTLGANDLAVQGRRAGFRVRCLEQNLSPFRRRQSYVFERC